jgi:hypothetical protein
MPDEGPERWGPWSLILQRLAPLPKSIVTGERRRSCHPCGVAHSGTPMYGPQKGVRKTSQLNGIDVEELRRYVATVEQDSARADRDPVVVARWVCADRAEVTSSSGVPPCSSVATINQAP